MNPPVTPPAEDKTPVWTAKQAKMRGYLPPELYAQIMGPRQEKS